MSFSLVRRRTFRSRLVVPAVAALLSICTTQPAAIGQLLQRPLVLKNVRLMTMDGAPIDKGTLVVSGDKITAAGRDVKVPMLAKTLDASGATVTPGLIDACSLLGRASTAAGSSSAARRAEDDFDGYATELITDALRHGVTTVFLSPRGPTGLCGTGALIRLAPTGDGAGPYGQVLRSEAALCIDLASKSSAIARLKTLAAIDKALAGAQQYQESLDNYEQSLATYIKQLDQANDKDKKKKNAAQKPPASAAAGTAEKKTATATKSTPTATKKPQRPRRNPQAETMLRALRHEIPVRVIAYRSSDILNALELAKKYSLELILDGATEAYLVAPAVAQADAVVILGRLDAPMASTAVQYRRGRYRPGNALTAAGVRWIVGSGADSPASARYPLLNAQLASSGAGDQEILKSITASAADVLDVGKQIGRLRPGMLADLVVWSGNPLDPATRVLRVFVGGKQVYPSTL